MVIKEKESFAIDASLMVRAPLLGVLIPIPCQKEYSAVGNYYSIPDIISKNVLSYNKPPYNTNDSFMKKHSYLGQEYLNLHKQDNDSLVNVESVTPNYQKQGENWSIAFSPNHSYMAWSAGMRKVFLIKLDAFTDKTLPISNFSQNNRFSTITDSTISLECGHTVWSVAFGSALFPTSTPQTHRLTPQTPDTAPFKDLTSRSVNKRFHFELEPLIFATGLGNGQIKIWQIPSGNLLTILFDHTEPVRALRFSPDSSLNLVSGSLDRTLKVWDMRDDGNMTTSINVSPYQTRVKAISWSPNATLLACVGGSSKAYVWVMKGKTLLQKLLGHMHEVVDCDFSMDGALLATASYDTCSILWDPYLGTALKKFGHLFPPPRPIFASGPNNHYVRGVSFSPDGRHLATVADDGYMRIWDICLSKEIPCMIGITDSSLCCKFSTRSPYLATGDKFGRLMLWHTNLGSSLQNCINPNRLDHLCRLRIRTLVPDTNKINSALQDLVPKKLLCYIEYLTLQK